MAKRAGKRASSAARAARATTREAPKKKSAADVRSVAQLKRELAQARHQQAATADALKALASSHFDLHAVLKNLLISAKKLCGADNTFFYLREGEFYRLATCIGFTKKYENFLKQRAIAPGRDTLVARTVLEGRIVHIPDVLEDPEYTYHEAQKQGG